MPDKGIIILREKYHNYYIFIILIFLKFNYYQLIIISNNFFLNRIDYTYIARIRVQIRSNTIIRVANYCTLMTSRCFRVWYENYRNRNSRLRDMSFYATGHISSRIAIVENFSLSLSHPFTQSATDNKQSINLVYASLFNVYKLRRICDKLIISFAAANVQNNASVYAFG